MFSQLSIQIFRHNRYDTLFPDELLQIAAHWKLQLARDGEALEALANGIKKRMLEKRIVEKNLVINIRDPP